MQLSAFNASAIAKPALPATAAGKTPQFGGNLLQQAAGQSGLAKSLPRKMLRTLDFQDLATTTVNQIKLIYGMVILSRFAAASTRSANELRETVTRDAMGYTFWLFTVPILQRMMLKGLIRDDRFRDALIMRADTGARTGLAGTLKSLNPLTRYAIPTSQQIKDRAAQTLFALADNGVAAESQAYQAAKGYFDKLLVKRNLVSAAGVGLTIGLLGVVMPMINMAITRANVAKGNVGK